MDGPRAWPVPHSDPDGTFYIPVNANNIETAFYHASTLRDRLLHKRFYSLAIHHLRDHHPATADHEKRLDNLSSVLERASAIPHCSPIRIVSGRSLLEAVDEVVADASFIFGPASQKPGEAEDDCRFICIFCHKVRTRTGDLRVHLHKDHNFNKGDIDQMINSCRLRVFGQYSHEDVKANNWDILKWKPRRSRASQTTAGEEASSPSQKRKRKQRTLGKSPQANPCSPGEGSSSMKRPQSSAAYDYTDTASQTLLYSEFSPVSSWWPVDDSQCDLHNSLSHAFWPGVDGRSLAGSLASDETLAQVGSLSRQQNLDTPSPRDDLHLLHLPSNEPLIDRLVSAPATGSIVHPRYPPEYMQPGGQRRH